MDHTVGEASGGAVLQRNKLGLDYPRSRRGDGRGVMHVVLRDGLLATQGQVEQRARGTPPPARGRADRASRD